MNVGVYSLTERVSLERLTYTGGQSGSRTSTRYSRAALKESTA
jgi:hypothetical protein